jgi:ribonuclease HI
MIIYTDGSAHPNPGPGGFGVVVCDDSNNIIHLYSKQTNNTTNNREEIKAILWALLNYGKANEEVIVYSDSNYCVQTFTNWMFGWARNNWVKSDKKIPENLDLIQAYYNALNEGYKINLKKVKGHAGNKYNELADGLATGKVKPQNG